MGNKQQRQLSPRLFRVFASTDRESVIARFPYQRDSDVEFGFAEAGRRLAASFKGSAIDDAILMPFMYLWRHAVELSLKGQIKYAARLRRMHGEDDPSLDPENVRTWLENTHSLGKLATRLAEHFTHLNLPKLPTETRCALQWLAEADPDGQTFRYAGGLPDTQDFIDFHRLSKCLEETYRVVSLGDDVLSAFGETVEDALAARREYDEEMRAEYEAEMREHLGDGF